MPQMAPYNWLSLNLMFIMILIMMISMIHSYNLTPLKFKMIKMGLMKKIKINW